MRQLSLLALLFFVAIVSCKKNDLKKEGQSGDNASAVYKTLRDIGFSPADIKDLGDYYLVDGDLLFKKVGTNTSSIQHYFEKGANAGKTNVPRTEQWVRDDIVSS